MKENYINLEAYVNGHPIYWKLNPAPKTLHDEIHEFAGSICALSKILICNQSITDKSVSGNISVMFFCEGHGIPCPSFSFNEIDFSITNGNLNHKMFNYQLELVDVIAATVVSEAKFKNQ